MEVTGGDTVTRDRYHTLFDELAEPIFVLSTDVEPPEFVEANAAAARMLGLESPSELAGRSPLDVTSETGPDGVGTRAVVAQAGRAAREVGRARAALTMKRRDGELVEVEWRLTAMQLDGRSRLVAVATELARADEERELEAHRRRYETLFESTADALCMIDTEGLFFDCNAAALTAFAAASKQNLMGLTPVDLSPAMQADGTPTPDAASAHIQRTFEEGAARFEWTHQRLDGTTFPAEVQLTRLDVGASPIVQASVRDISERKRIEAERVRQLETIEEQAEEIRELSRRQAATIRELSTPVIEVWRGVLCLPVIGVVDTARSAEMTEKLLGAIARERASVAIVDITGIDVLDTATADHFLRMAQSARLLGARCVLTGVSPAIALTLSSLGGDLRELETMPSLREALESRLGGGAHARA